MQELPIMADPLPEMFRDRLADRFRVLSWDTSPESTALRTAVALVTYAHPRVDGELLEHMPRLRVISNHGVGVDHIDLAAARAREVPVGNTPGCLDEATADMTMALLLAAARNVVVGDRYARSPAFTVFDPSMHIGREVSGSVLGIVGLGRIGRQVARRALGFGMTILYHNRRRDPHAEKQLGARYVTLEELLAESDFVTLHCPLTAETTGLIGQAQLARMKPTAILVNMARGPVVETDALYEALREKRIGGAALDVTEPEPLPRDHPLLSLDNVVITPHLGSASDRTRQRMMEMTIENLEAGVEGRPLPYPVEV